MSDKPLSERLRIKPQSTLALINHPPKYQKLLGGNFKSAKPDSADTVQLFIRSKSELDSQLPALAKQLKSSAILWVTYPKLTSSIAGDLNRDLIRKFAPSIGLTTVAQIAVDEDWSALRLKRVDRD